MRRRILSLVAFLAVLSPARFALADGEKAPLVVAAPDASTPTDPGTPAPEALGPRVVDASLTRATTPPPPLAEARRATPPPAPPTPMKRPTRWYGWQVLLVHGVSDLFVVGGLVGMEADVGGGFVATAIAPILRGVGTGLLEAAHHDVPAGVLWGAGNFLLPLVGAAAIGRGVAGDRTVREGEDVEPFFARGFAAGALLGGSVMTAIEASVAFEDRPTNVGVHVSPSFVSVDVAF